MLLLLSTLSTKLLHLLDVTDNLWRDAHVRAIDVSEAVGIDIVEHRRVDSGEVAKLSYPTLDTGSRSGTLTFSEHALELNLYKLVGDFRRRRWDETLAEHGPKKALDRGSKSFVVKALEHRAEHDKLLGATCVNFGRTSHSVEVRHGKKKVVIEDVLDAGLDCGDILADFLERGRYGISGLEAASSGAESWNVGDGSRKQRGRLVLHLNISEHRWRDHFVEGLSLTLSFVLKLLNVRESIHSYGAAISII